MAPHKRGPWSQEEDDRLLRLVNTQGAHYWVRISHMLGTRSPKQCRERFHQNLKPSLNHKPITPEEGLLIERLVGEMGKRWAEIARRLHGRSDNAVKNWWNGGMNRRRRLVVRGGGGGGGAAGAAGEDSGLVGGGPLPSPVDVDGRYEHARPFPRSIPGLERNPIRTTILPAPGQYVDRPLPSPTALSDVSQAASADGAPSLVSDSGSLPSTSPCISLCPPIELPPLGGHAPEPRRVSLPTFHLGSHTYLAEGEALPPAWSARSDADRKGAEPCASQALTLSRPSLPPVVISSPTEQGGRSPPPPPPPAPASAPASALAPASPVRLPSFQALTDAVERPEVRDGRMALSSLLR